MTEKTTTQFKELERGEIVIDEVTVAQNFRKEFNEAQLKELADNIAKVGVLEPIILRKNRAYKVLVAGERRLRAAKLAGLETIPYRLLDLTEEEALEVTALENLHRANLNPMEEAQAFQTLLQKGKYTVQDVADRIDKSKDYVYRTLRLLDLPESAQQALIAGEINFGHARQLLRLPPKKVEEMLKDVKKNGLNVRQLKSSIDYAIGRDLTRVHFPLTEEYAGCMACSKCPYNTANQQSLFDEAIEEGACTNSVCFGKKEKAYFEELLTAVKEKAENAKMGFLEPDRIWGNSYGTGNQYIMDEPLQKQFANEIKKHPEKFALTINLEGDEEALVCVDEKLNEKIEKILYPEPDEEDEESENEWERENAIRKKEDELLAKHLADKLSSVQVDEERFADKFCDNFDDWQVKLLSQSFGTADLSVAELSKLPAPALLKALYVLMCLSGWRFGEDLQELVGEELTTEEVEKIHEQAVAAVDKKQK